MTAINVVRLPRALHVITDGAYCDAEGILRGTGAKIAIFAHLNAVIAVRGARAILPILAAFVDSAAPTYDEFKKSAAELLRGYCEPARQTWETSFGDRGADFDLIVAGLSNGGAPDSYFLTTHDQHGVTPWTVTDLPEAALMPATTEMFDEFFPVDTSAETFDPVKDGLALLERQRTMPVACLGHASEGFVVGGFAQLTSVTPNGITTCIIRRWPDMVGQRLSGSVQKRGPLARSLLGNTMLSGDKTPIRRSA